MLAELQSHKVFQNLGFTPKVILSLLKESDEANKLSWEDYFERNPFNPLI